MIQLILFSWLSLSSFTKQNEFGLDALSMHESKVCISLCNTFSFPKFGLKWPIVPMGYELVFESKETPLANKVRAFRKGSTLVLVFRGTVNQANSWLENIHFMQIAAQDTLIVNNDRFHYKFSEHTGAQVHSGYVLGIYFLLMEMQGFLREQLNAGVNRILLTGHSQGGALAQLFLAHLSFQAEFEDIGFSNYSFGSPKVGNQAFARDFNNRFLAPNQSFRYINEKDIVCAMPLANYQYEIDFLNFQTTFDMENATSLLEIGKDLLPESYRSKIDHALYSTLTLANEIVRQKVGEVVFPPFSPNVFYSNSGKTVWLNEQPVPEHVVGYDTEKNSVWISFFVEDKGDIGSYFYQHYALTYYLAVNEKLNPRN